jgi:hypothetical protein
MERRGALEGLRVLGPTDEPGRLAGILAFPAEVTPGALDPYAAAPTFGQDTLEVYEELAGMSVGEIAAAIGEELFSR